MLEVSAEPVMSQRSSSERVLVRRSPIFRAMVAALLRVALLACPPLSTAMSPADDFHVLAEFAYILSDFLDVVFHPGLTGFNRLEPPVGGLDEAIDLRSEDLHLVDELGEPFREVEKVLAQQAGA